MSSDGAPADAPYRIAAPTDGLARAAPDCAASVHTGVPALDALLRAGTSAERDAAWARLVDEHSRLLLHVARTVENGRDDAMDAYAYILDRLRRDDHRVLRRYQRDGRTRFTTWLVVVVRRMCLDFRRQRVGRPRNATPSAGHDAERRARMRLHHLASVPSELQMLVDAEAPGPEERMRERQLLDALERAVSALPPDEQLLLRLRFDDGRSVPEIARMIRAPTPFHVYRRLRSVCASLRDSLARDGIDEGAP